MNSAHNPRKHQADLLVFSIVKESACAECGAALFRGELLRLERETALCMACADLDHLVYLPRGDTALTRRSRQYSGLSAVVMRFSRSRKRYERQGVLVEADALARAEAECLQDDEARALARERAAAYRERVDARYVAAFAEQVRARYSGCPPEEAEVIAGHACRKYSGRVGRSAQAKQFDPETIELAVRAAIRHRYTDYDDLLCRGYERSEARAAVEHAVTSVADRWKGRAT
jgi:hypothetical protein